ncbi:uncharacterized protein LOC135082911 [Ostrinia nubilalis]|uniref:uncharacterized protein LOC135082911 n=1 Tax=Ostrinia nubilalis TaxID=29057 RepID=UPI003082237B
MKLFYFALALVLIITSFMTADAIDCNNCQPGYKPVCATNGKTYRNLCKMQCAGAKWKNNGQCGIVPRYPTKVPDDQDDEED